MKHFFLLAGIFSVLLITSCDPKTKESLIKTGNDILNSATTNTTSPSLSNADVINGLKEALTVGANNSISLTSKFDGFNKNPLIYISWPQEAIVMKDRLMQLGFQTQIKDFETSLNRAAEEATKNAVPVFVNAISNMTISDGFAILNGNDTAATHYLREKTYISLKERFLPTVTDAINKVNVTSYWSPLVTNYNRIPGVQKQNPNLNNYVTDKAINGLMTLIAQEETKIRKDPMARVTDILKKVFGAQK